ncbi:transmembrane protein 39A-B-like isoform X3 [Mya arenaria]|uniref:transmembrane protein 39A-B-like isoform X3 n=1 Tax=Mya arenaria TaxID=6604 RepID=UPI0022E66D24|nr:transmembrane protein 39A-B-like isoform X3 [Mya arenaria]XP_052811592.1 transmembrane protein 39A-B-like isoform X3 [Mya arenaria]
MPAGRRILSRLQTGPTFQPGPHKSLCAGHSDDRDANLIPLATMAVLPKHAHIPEIQGDTNISFEAMLYVFGFIVMCLQYINLYKTVWWLPNSHANYALNFYLIDPYLVAFLCVLMSRRLLWCFVQEIYGPRSGRGLLYMLVQACKVTLVSLAVISLFFTVFHVLRNHSLLYCLFLCCPIVTYIFLFGPTVKPLYLKSLNWPSSVAEKYSPKHKPGVDREQVLYHNCVMSPEVIRDEVENLKVDFNNRVKQILFNSMLTSYYMTFVPLCFAQNNCDTCWNTLYYDTWWVGQHVFLTWLSAFLMLCAHFLPPRYLDLMHRCSQHLGRWQKVEGRHAHVPYNAWSELQVWPQGALVKHVRGLFKAEGVNVTAEPGNSMHGRFYFLFHRPLRVLNWMLILTWLLVGYQFFVLLQCSEWNHIICIALVLFCNYYTLFKLLRDRIILSKTYKDDDSGQN